MVRNQLKTKLNMKSIIKHTIIRFKLALIVFLAIGFIFIYPILYLLIQHSFLLELKTILIIELENITKQSEKDSLW